MKYKGYLIRAQFVSYIIYELDDNGDTTFIESHYDSEAQLDAYVIYEFAENYNEWIRATFDEPIYSSIDEAKQAIDKELELQNAN